MEVVFRNVGESAKNLTRPSRLRTGSAGEGKGMELGIMYSRKFLRYLRSDRPATAMLIR